MKKDFSKIKLFAMDVDGTLTDGKIYIGNDGEVMKAFNAKDGLGIKLLIKGYCSYYHHRPPFKNCHQTMRRNRNYRALSGCSR